MKNYKLAPVQTYKDINHEVQHTAQNLEMDRGVECMAKWEAYVTLKDHKDNFTSTLPCWLINPAKSEISIVSKSILNDILTTIRWILQLNDLACSGMCQDMMQTESGRMS